jgi:hypothetical protein
MIEIICTLFILAILIWSTLTIMRLMYVRRGYFRHFFCDYMNHHVVSEDMNIYTVDGDTFGYCKYCGRKLKYSTKTMEWEDSCYKFWS